METGKIVMEIPKGLKRIDVREAKLDPEKVRARILERWRRLGRRAKPGDPTEASLEDEFS